MSLFQCAIQTASAAQAVLRPVLAQQTRQK
jgi:hypothetical protein